MIVLDNLQEDWVQQTAAHSNKSQSSMPKSALCRAVDHPSGTALTTTAAGTPNSAPRISAPNGIPSTAMSSASGIPRFARQTNWLRSTDFSKPSWITESMQDTRKPGPTMSKPFATVVISAPLSAGNCEELSTLARDLQLFSNLNICGRMASRENSINM